eukprot:230062_1
MGNKTSSIFQENEILMDVLVHGYMREMYTADKIQTVVINTIIDYVQFEYYIYKFSKGASNICYDEQFSKLFQNNRTCSLSSDIYYGRHKYYIIDRKNNKLFGKGININNCLGIKSETNEVKTFTELIFDENPKITDKIKFLSNGIRSHQFMITETKIFYGWGNNKNYQIGYAQNNEIIETPIRLSTLTQIFYEMTIIKIECGMTHTLFLSNEGKIFATGSNKFGCCGQQKEFKRAKEPIHINTSTANNGLGFVTDIAVGSTFNLLLDKNKKLWCFGSNTKNQLGFDGGYEHKAIEYIPIINPQLNDIDFDIVKCGDNHSLCIEKKTKKCFVFGSNYSGQITNDKQTKVYRTMYKNIVNGWCGENYTVLLNKQDKIMVLGDIKATNDMLLNFEHKTKNDVIVRVIAAYSEIVLVVKR